jgi:hypothetical protein
MRNIFSETALAARRLRGNLGFSLTIILTLALGVGANVGIFTIVNHPTSGDPDLKYPESRFWIF